MVRIPFPGIRVARFITAGDASKDSTGAGCWRWGKDNIMRSRNEKRLREVVLTAMVTLAALTTVITTATGCGVWANFEFGAG